MANDGTMGNHDKHQAPDAEKLVPTQTNAPEGAPVAIDADNRSDANDGVERPLGFYSSQAQADRNSDHPGQTPANEAAGGPGFYSAEQQAVRNDPSLRKDPTDRD